MLSSQIVASLLDSIASATKLTNHSFWQRSNGAWIAVGTHGRSTDQAASTVLNRLSRENIIVRGDAYSAVQLPTKSMAWAICWPNSTNSTSEHVMGSVAWIASLVDSFSELQADRTARIKLERIAQLSSAWLGIRDIKELLEKIANAAIELFEADRASMFLADKQSRQLVGYPAIGISKGVLRVPDNVGVVGAVYQTLQPRRWNISDPVDEVNRTVDQASGYQTKSLLAIPLLDRRSKPLGVFELINSKNGSFTRIEEDLLVHLAAIAASAIASTQQVQNLLSGRGSVVNAQPKPFEIIGTSNTAQRLAEEIAVVAKTDLSVLLIGENGTGKEVAARAIHGASQRMHQPFIAVNCAAITETLLESELFGHERGAFTDAYESRVGKFELASGGTLMLDEIGDMSLTGQAKLLRVLEDRTVTRVGGSESISVNVRVIAATNQNIPLLISQGRFREDLYYRLNVVPIEVPPLRERLGDVEAIARHFLDQFVLELNREPMTLSPSAVDKLKSHSWPGNIRELRNVILRVVAMCPASSVEAEHIRFITAAKATQQSDLNEYTKKTLVEATNEFQIAVIEQHIEAAENNITQAAETLGLQRSNLYRKMKQLGMKQPNIKPR